MYLIWRSRQPLRREVEVPTKPSVLSITSALAATLALVLWLATTGCVVEEPRAYSCAILYQCGEEPVTARTSVECEIGTDEAAASATQRGLDIVYSACPDNWQYVQTICQEQQSEPCSP